MYMYMCVNVCVYVYVCVYICMCIYVRVCVCVYMYMCMYVCIYRSLLRTPKGYKAHQDITFNSVMANIHNDNILHTQICSKTQY